MGKQNFICVVLTFATALHAEAQTMRETEILFNNLTSGYNKMIRPAADQRNAVDVDIHYDVMGIQGVDEIKGEITVNVFLTLWWKDHRLSWVPGDNNNLRSIMMEHGTVWKPELRLMNPATPVTSQEFSWPHVRYSYDGSARWAPNGFYEVSCSIDIKYYPMDVQTCIVRFQVSSYLVSEINIVLPDGTAQKKRYVENGEWDLIKSMAFVDSQRYAQFQIQLVLARRSTLLMLITVLPSVLLSILNIMVFLLPPESGERISFTLTLLLALAVFLTIMSDNIPKSSSPMPILSYLFGLQLFLSAIICFVTVINLNFYYKEDRTHNVSCLSFGCLKHKGHSTAASDQIFTDEKSCQKSAANTQSDLKPSVFEIGTSDAPSRIISPKSRCTCRSSKEPEATTQLTSVDKVTSQSRLTWKDISKYVDRVMFIVSFMYSVVLTGVILYILQTRGGSNDGD